jgi:hypothetical protein
MSNENAILNASKRLIRDAVKISLELFRIMVPLIILIKLLQELDVIEYLALPLGPVMKLVGLPAEMGLVWATAIFNNPYAAVIVLLSFIRDSPITTAQVTVLCVLMLVAHCLPVELRIAQKSGARLPFQALLRLGGAFLLGWVLHSIYTGFHLLQEPAKILLKPDIQSSVHGKSWTSWAMGQAQDLLSIFFIILGLLAIIRILEKLKVTELMNRLLQPVLTHLGIGQKATTIAIIGLTLGISLGGGLIIHESRSGNVDRKDVFYSLSLMGLSHSLIEDTLFMLLLGARISGLLLGRVLFSLVVVALMVRISLRLSQSFCERYLWVEDRS